MIQKPKFIFFIALALISFLYLFLRLNNISTLLEFRLDQGIHLLETKHMFDSQKISLIGPLTSKSFEGRSFFTGANYYYVLGIFGLIGRWNPLTITVLFIIFEYIFYLFFIFFLKKRFNSFYSLSIFLFIALSPFLVIHSRFFWNPHLLVPLSILVLYFLDKFLLKKQFKFLFIAAFFWGFAIACHYTAVFWGFAFLYALIKSKNFLNFKSYPIILLAVLIGDLPFFIFEFRHGFYNLKTMFYVYTNSSQGYQMTSYYFVFSLLIFIICLSLYLFSKIKPKKIAYISLITIIIIITLSQIKIYPQYRSLGFNDNWNYQHQLKGIDLILKNGCPKNFNIAATIHGDTRFYDYRYLLSLKNCFPLSIESYSNPQTLFLVAPATRPPETETVWEISSFKPFTITQQIKLNDQAYFYQLDH